MARTGRRHSLLTASSGTCVIVLSVLLAAGKSFAGVGRRSSRPSHGCTRCSPDDKVGDSKASAGPSADEEVARLRAEAERLRKEAAELNRKPQEAPKEFDSKADSEGEASKAASVANGMSTRAIPADELLKVDEAAEEAAVLLASPTVLQSMRALLQYKRQEGGEELLKKLVERACGVLNSGTGSYAEVLGDASAWPEGSSSVQTLAEDLVALLSAGPEISKEAEEGKCSPERRAVLDLIIYDQLPDAYAAYGQYLELEEEQSKRDQYAQEVTLLDPSLTRGMSEEQKVAAKFARRLEKVPSATQQVRDRLRRLQAVPVVQQMQLLAAEDNEWSELLSILAPMDLQIYNATRTAQLRTRSLSKYQMGEVSVVSLEFTLPQLLGGVAAVLAAVYIIAQAIDSAVPQAREQSLPVYQSSRTPQT
mmetsp:Transcript_64034/g.118976  ORF Transcript_64034/g.118976 Transcript_64034/m.118976 type:complete len:422 (-) Transcript_64034:8-1273(-)